MDLASLIVGAVIGAVLGAAIAGVILYRRRVEQPVLSPALEPAARPADRTPDRSPIQESEPAPQPLDHADMPGDDDARLVSVRVIDQDSRPTSTVAVDEPFGIEVTFQVLRAGKNIQPALHFRDAADHYLFVVAYTDPEWLTDPPPVGRHETTAWVPAHMMNTGTIHLTVALATPDPFERHCVVEQAVSFTVVEREGDTTGARGLQPDELPGAIRPRLDWETARSYVSPPV